MHSELLINLPRGEIRIWLYLSEPLCQRISSDLAKGKRPEAAFRRLKHLLTRMAHAFKDAVAHHHHLPPEILVVGEAPNVDGMTHDWLRSVGHRLAAKISEWTVPQLAQYLTNNVEEIKRLCASRHDGVTLRFTLTRVPGLDLLLRLSQGKPARELSAGDWPKGSPNFEIVARAGFAISRLRD